VWQIARTPGTRAPVRVYLARLDATEMHLRMRQGDFSMAEKWQSGNLSSNLYEMGMQAALDIRQGETPRAIELGKKIIESAARAAGCATR